jgi:hypothetical protein
VLAASAQTSLVFHKKFVRNHGIFSRPALAAVILFGGTSFPAGQDDSLEMLSHDRTHANDNCGRFACKAIAGRYIRAEALAAIGRGGVCAIVNASLRAVRDSCAAIGYNY